MLIRFAVAYLLTSFLLLGVTVLVYRSASSHRDSMVREAETHAVGMRQEAVTSFLRDTMADLDLLANLNGVRDFEAGAPGWKDNLLREAASFLAKSATYDQLFVADVSGEEVAHVERDASGAPTPAPKDVVTNIDLAGRGPAPAEGTPVILPFTLASRNGVTEVPAKPILGLGLGLWRDGRCAGVVYLGVLASALLRKLDAAHPEPDSESMLLDGAGYWMRGASPQAEWGDLIPGRQGAAFTYAFADEWRHMAGTEAGQFETSDGLFTYQAIHPLAALEAEDAVTVSPAAANADPSSDTWWIVSRVPRPTVLATRYVGLRDLILADGLGVLALGIASWILVQRTTRAKQFRSHVVSENAALSSTIGRYLPKLSSARHRGALSNLGGESRFVAVLFADIRGFTRFSETRSPDEVVGTLNRALSRITTPVTRHGGILDKYTGDGLLAFFEPRDGDDDAARRAVGAALDMQVAFSALQKDSSDAALGELGLGIGINAGRVIVGNIGSAEIMDYTVIGDAVNVAARLQAAAESGQILVTDAIYELLRDELAVESVEPLRLRGRQQSVRAHRLRCAV